MVTDPLGLQRCATCTNAFIHQRREDGTCANCGGRFDPPGEPLDGPVPVDPRREE